MRMVTMPADDFMTRCRRQISRSRGESDDEGFVYFTSRLDDPQLGGGEVFAAAAGWEDGVLDPDAAAHPAASESYPSVWIGGHGSTTQAHYDVSNNYFAQIEGEKRFRMWGPEHHWSLHVFPDAHPRARKAQIDIDGDPATPPPAMDVILRPGDAILVPAFWFHHVEARGDCSVSTPSLTIIITCSLTGSICARPWHIFSSLRHRVPRSYIHCSAN